MIERIALYNYPAAAVAARLIFAERPCPFTIQALLVTATDIRSLVGQFPAFDDEQPLTWCP